MSTRTAARLAWTMWAFTVCLTLFAVLFIILNRSTAFPTSWCCAGFPGLLTLGLVMASSTVGALIAARRAEQPIGWIFCFSGLAIGIELFALGYAVYTGLTQPGSLPGGAVMAWIASWIWVPGWGLILAFLLLLFPNGRLPSRRWQPVAWFVAGALAANMLTRAFMPGPLGWSLPVFRNPFGIGGAAGQALMAVETISWSLFLLSVFASAISLIRRLRRAAGVERQQIKWLTYAGAMAGIVFLSSVIFYDKGLRENPWFQALAFAPFAGIPISAGIAILKHRLYDIDLIINRTFVYVLLTAIVIGLYVLVVGLLGALFQVRGSLTGSLVATGLVAVLFQPLRDRLQGAINRLMYGERDDPYAVLSRLGQRLEAVLAPEPVLPTLAETIAQTLKLPYVAIEVERTDPEPDKVVATYGPHAAIAAQLPLCYQSERVGTLLVAARAPGEPFTPAEQRLLSDIAHQAGVAVHAARLTADLQHSRERLVTTREEERRRIRRDLHDGLGPTLASHSYRLDAVLDLIDEDPAASKRMIADLKAQTQTTLADIRRLVYELRPPALDELGLVAALQAQFSDSPNGLRIRVEASPEALPPLSAAVEVAAYRIAAEAMNNAVRHAQAQNCRVRLIATNDKLTVEISDDGQGLPDGARTGVGLTSMKERAAELGGVCTIEPNPIGGTRVRAHLPALNQISET